MKKLQSLCQCCAKCPQSLICSLWIFLCFPKANLSDLNIPVTKLIPQEIINLLNCNTQFIFFHIVCYFFDHIIQSGKDPLILIAKRSNLRFCYGFVFQVHKNKTRSIPDLICEVTTGLYTLPVKTHIISRCVTGHQRKTKCISAILVNDFKRINTVSKGFTHLAALGISYQSMDQYMVERSLSCLLKSREYHTDNPEENNIISGYQHICRIEVLQFWCLVWPAKCGEWPQC